MKLILDKNISKYYLQTLCLLFFPGAKFSENEVVTPDTPIVQVNKLSLKDATSRWLQA